MSGLRRVRAAQATDQRSTHLASDAKGRRLRFGPVYRGTYQVTRSLTFVAPTSDAQASASKRCRHPEPAATSVPGEGVRFG